MLRMRTLLCACVCLCVWMGVSSVVDATQNEAGAALPESGTHAFLKHSGAETHPTISAPTRCNSTSTAFVYSATSIYSQSQSPRPPCAFRRGAVLGSGLAVRTQTAAECCRACMAAGSQNCRFFSFDGGFCSFRTEDVYVPSASDSIAGAWPPGCRY